MTGKNRLSNVLIGIVYQPSSKQNEKLEWLNKFESLVSQAVIVHHGPIIITGDFNIDLLVPSTASEAYQNILVTLNLKQLITQPTRNSRTLIDHVVSNVDTKLIASDVVLCDEISDHDSPFCILKINKPRYEPRHKYIRDERTLVLADYINDFQQLPLNIVYAFDNTSDKVNALNKLITECIDRHAPVRKIKLTRPSSPWMKDLDVRDLQRQKYELRQNLKDNRNNEQLDQLRNVRNNLKSTIRGAKKKFLKNLLANKSQAETWKVINKLLHPRQKRMDVDPDEINKFFNSTAIRTTGRNAGDLSKSFIEELPENPDSFHLRPATYDEVSKAIQKLRSDCSTGHDNIPSKFIKPVSQYLTSPLTDIINSCIQSLTFPEEWKISRICPVPKVTDPQSLIDYRPISILPILSKVLERIILQQLAEHIEEKSIYLESQSGFRKSHSTITVLLKLKDDIKLAMSRSEVTLSVFADFSKAFDTVDYRILIKQLSNLGFSRKVLHLIRDYLSERKQYAQIDDKSSSKLDVQFGVPQGSILGPILFNLYVTTINTNGPSTYLLYADDTTLLRHTKIQELQSAIESVQNEIDNINLWSEQNNLCLNAKKTKMAIFSTRQLAQRHSLADLVTVIKSAGQDIEQVKNFKVLGVRFNEHLDWTEHVNHTLKSCFSTLRNLKRFKNTASWQQRKMLMESLVLSKLTYGIALLSDATKAQIERLQKVQNAAAGFVLKRYARTSDVIDLEWLPVAEMVDLTIAKIAHSALHNPGWPSYLKLNRQPDPGRELRNGNLVAHDIEDTSRLTGTFAHEAAKCFNNLPVDIKRIDKKESFADKCWNFYFDRALAKSLS